MSHLPVQCTLSFTKIPVLNRIDNSIPKSKMPSRFLFPLLQITRRYAEFSAAIVGISESFPNEQVTKLLAQLLDEVECFVLRMAAIFPGRKEQLIFLINNYDMVLSILMVRFIIYNNPRGNNIPGNI